MADKSAVEVAVDSLIENIKSTWKQGQDGRMELGKQFSELREKTKNYKKGEDGMSYADAVKKTGVPRSTAEKYRQMYEVCLKNEISQDVFLLLCEEGFNLATDVADGCNVAGILGDHPKLKGNADELDFAELAKTLKDGYGKKANARTPVEELEQELAGTKSEEIKRMISTKLKGLKLKALSAVANVLGPMLGWTGDQVVAYQEKIKSEEAELNKRYAAAVKLAKDLFGTSE